MAPRQTGTTPPPPPSTTVPSGRRNPAAEVTTTTAAPVVPVAPSPTPTTIPAPTTTATTVPVGRRNPAAEVGVAPAPAPQMPSYLPWQSGLSEAELTQARGELARAQRQALGIGISPAEVQSVVEQEGPNWALKALGKFFNWAPIKYGIVKPLEVIDVGRRTIVGATGEIGQTLRGQEWFQDFLKLPGAEAALVSVAPFIAPVALSKPRTYEKLEDIPRDPVTGEYLYKVGDIREEEKGSFGDWWSAIKDPTYGYGDYVNTGNKWADRALGFTGDVLLDPTTYLTLGTGTVVKTTAKEAIEAGVGAISREVLLSTADDVARKAVQAADDSARFAGGFLTDAEKALIFNRERAASIAAQEAAQASLTPAQQAVVQNLRRQAAVGPRRTLGAKSREELAQTVRELRDYAAQIGNQRVVDILSDDVIGQIATRGYSALRGEVANALGIRGGIRFGVGSAKVILPGTERIADTFGTVFSTLRVGTAVPIASKYDNKFIKAAVNTVNKGFVNTTVGRAILNGTTPIGEGGLFGTADIVRMRQALRTGTYQGEKLGGKEANDFVRLLAQDNAYRGLKAATLMEANQLLKPLYQNQDFGTYSNSVIDILEKPGLDLATATAADVSAAVGRQVTDAELAVARQIREVGDEFYARANFLYQRAQVAAGTPPHLVNDLPKNAAWFPHTMSDKARRFLNARQNLSKSMGDALDSLGVDRSFALAGSNLRQLVAGSNWFGYTLTKADIDQGIKRLNQIAKERGGLNFDFFETNAERAFNKYATGWARDVGFQNFIYNMTLATEALRRGSPAGATMGDTYLGDIVETIGGGPFAEKAFAGELTQESAKLVTGVAMPYRLASLQDAINSVVTPERIRALDVQPVLRKEADDIVDEMKKLRADVETKGAAGELVFADTVNDTINNIEQRLLELERIIPEASLPPGYGAALTSEAQALLQSFKDEMAGLRTGVRDIDPAKWAQTVPIFIDAANQFLQLNRIKYPGVISSPEFMELITNVRRLEDPVFVRGMNRALGGINRMFKGWVTATPGFHVRNALSNVFFMALAGANPANLLDGARVFNAYRSFLKRISEEGLPMAGAGGRYLDETEIFGSQVVAQFLQSPEAAKAGIDKVIGKLSPADVERVKADLFYAAPMTGYGQVGDIFEGVGRLGITGGMQTRTGVLPSVSRNLGKPLSWSRGVGNDIENWTRFALLWDGLKQGYSPEEAANRVKKYLIDYSDLSQVDQVARTVIPFWMWASRSLPLILESSWYNPRAFQIWNSFTRNLEDEQAGEGMFLPRYLSAAVPVGGNFLFNPDFGYQRSGEAYSNLLDPRGILSSLTPAVRAPIEAALNYRASTGGQIYNEQFQEPGDAQTRYLIEQLVPQLGFAGKVANVGIGALQAVGQIPGVPQEQLEAIAAAPQTLTPEIIREVLGIGKPAYIQEQQGVMTPEESRQRLLSFFGIPVTQLQPWQQTQVINDIVDELNAMISRRREEIRP